jgi:hypothetical protein
MVKNLSAAIVALSLVAVAQPASAQSFFKGTLAQVKAQQAKMQAAEKAAGGL